jgi:hypothetical protein
MSRRYSFWALTLFGGVLLLDIVVHLLRPPAGFSGSDYIEPGFAAVSIVAIWLLYRWLLQELNRMRGTVAERTLDRISQITFSMAFLGYLMFPLPLMLIRHP